MIMLRIMPTVWTTTVIIGGANIVTTLVGIEESLD